MKGKKDYSDTRMCKLAKKDIPAEDPGGYALLVKDAAYFCTKCGRTAAKKSMLCKPVKIDTVAAPTAETESGKESGREKEKRDEKKKKKKQKKS
jgi:hypothetical protein